jgi:hypothetical protein
MMHGEETCSLISFSFADASASHLFFQFALARAGQTVYFFISPLPALGKQDSNVLFHIHSSIGL